MDPVTSLLLLYTVTLIGSAIGVTVVSDYIADKIEHAVSKYRPNKK